jgi:hypothetical protein
MRFFTDSSRNLWSCIFLYMQDKPNYSELLKDPRWQRRRLEILSRDNFQCVKCDAASKTLHVHHRFYLSGRLPWDYPDNVLVSLCETCHKEEEGCKDVVNDFARSLQSWGYFNTDIRDLANDLITEKMNLLKQATDAKQNAKGLDTK